MIRPVSALPPRPASQPLKFGHVSMIVGDIEDDHMAIRSVSLHPPSESVLEPDDDAILVNDLLVGTHPDIATLSAQLAKEGQPADMSEFCSQLADAISMFTPCPVDTGAKTPRPGTTVATDFKRWLQRGTRHFFRHFLKHTPHKIVDGALVFAPLCDPPPGAPPPDGPKQHRP